MVIRLAWTKTYLTWFHEADVFANETNTMPAMQFIIRCESYTVIFMFISKIYNILFIAYMYDLYEFITHT